MIVAVVSALQLTAAEVFISIDGDSSVTVAADYQLSDIADSVRVVLMRIPDQSLRMMSPSFVRPVVRQGLYEIPVPRATRHTLSFRYRLSGDLRRIPVAIPSLPAVPGAASVRIVIDGLPDSLVLDDAFPRLTRQEDGRAYATLDNLPSFVRVEAESAIFTAYTFTGAAALLLVLGAAFWWFRRRMVAPPGSGS